MAAPLLLGDTRSARRIWSSRRSAVRSIANRRPRIPVSLRPSFKHHREVAALAPTEADRLRGARMPKHIGQKAERRELGFGEDC